MSKLEELVLWARDKDVRIAMDQGISYQKLRQHIRAEIKINGRSYGVQRSLDVDFGEKYIVEILCELLKQLKKQHELETSVERKLP